ncbi:hypothetical protein BJ741DRAFT_657838 [Chytriomyces cf. hyalinus JEL632]|nr:hypothetical protein BJ741DRAFT_657838 [Chytriomyces cf. hyalinus JEL632]
MSSQVFRNPLCDELVERPEPGINTIYDILVHGFSTMADNDILGERKLVRIVEEEKDVVKKVPGGGQVTETKKWKFFELSGFDWMTWSQVQSTTRAYASGYRQLGLKPGNKLAIYADTSRDWLLNAMACIQQSVTITTAYATLGEEGLVYSLQECEISTVFTNAELLPMINKVTSTVKTLKNIVYNGTPDADLLTRMRVDHPHLKILSLDELKVLGEAHPHPSTPPTKEDVALIMYTSGSTGSPKGVMLTHANVVAAVAGAYELIGKPYMSLTPKEESYLAFLPLSHILEFGSEMHLLYVGVKIGYGSVKTLTDVSVRNCKGDLRELRPTFMAGVPAVWESIRKAVESKLRSASPISRGVFNAAFNLKWALMTYGLNFATAPLDAAIFHAVKEQVGGRMKCAISGGAPIPKSTQQFLNVAVTTLVNGYGMTETTAGFMIQDPKHNTTLGIAGVPLVCSEVKLVDVENTSYKSTNLPKPQGEIWVRGPSVMKGYYKQPQLTRETMTEDGWLMTGDIAERNADGTFTIIDRKKNLVKLSNGEYIALEKLESNYKVSKFVQNICVHADSLQSYAIALIQPIEKEIRAVANDLKLYPNTDIDHIEYAELCDRVEVRAAVLESLKAVGKTVGFKGAEIVGQVYLCHDEWTPQNGMLTAAMKLQRKMIVNRFKKEIETMYSQ